MTEQMVGGIDFGACDICGAPATHTVRDHLWATTALDLFERFETLPGERRGCAVHPVKPRTYAHRLEIP